MWVKWLAQGHNNRMCSGVDSNHCPPGSYPNWAFSKTKKTHKKRQEDYVVASLAENHKTLILSMRALGLFAL